MSAPDFVLCRPLSGALSVPSGPGTSVHPVDVRARADDTLGRPLSGETRDQRSRHPRRCTHNEAHTIREYKPSNNDGNNNDNHKYN